MPPTERFDYDRDIPKHFVRYDGWLQACRAQYDLSQAAIQSHARKLPLTYFTFCASNAIDVFMLEKEGLLIRVGTLGKLNHVYFCENDDAEFEQIINLIRSEEAGFQGDFKKIVLFEDDDDTRGREELDPHERVPSKTVRDKFRYKHLNGRLRKLFPLDVINLDPYGVFFPPREDKYSLMLQAIEKIFGWQGNHHPEDDHVCTEFTLMLTTHLDQTVYNSGAVDNMKQIALSNIESYPAFSAAFNSKFGHVDPFSLRESDFPRFFSITLPKLISEIARAHGWFGHRHRIYIYARPSRVNPYSMMSSVCRYERIIPTTDTLPALFQPLPDPIIRKYVDEMCAVATNQPIDIDQWIIEDAVYANAVKADLESIVQFRQAFLMQDA
jgi:hypothetical protein